MGYRAKRTVYVLEFDDPELAGLEIKVSSTSIGVLLDLADDAESARIGGLDKAKRLLAEFMTRLVSWNLENEEGEPTPLTEEGFRSHEPDFVLTVVFTWFDAMMAIKDGSPLGRRSISGKQYPEVSLPMDLPSPNLPS